MLILLFWLTIYDVLPKEGLLLQTYSTDNIGRQNFFFSLGVAGCPYQSLGYEESMILNLKQYEMRIAVPFWIRFFDEYFHFYSLPKMIYVHPFCNLLPPEMKLNRIEVFTVKKAHLYIQNMHLNEVLTINEILSNSKNIFIPQLQMIRIIPGSVILYSIYICPTEPGNFRDIIFVKTNFGTISYSITYQAYRNPEDSFVPVLIHHYAQENINFSINLPSEIADSKKSIVFDASIFDSSRIFVSGNKLFIGSANIVTSNYITFVHVLGAESKYTFPLTILSSPKPLQPIYPMIVIPPIIHKGQKSETDVIIVNPTQTQYEITLLSLKNAPSFVKFKKVPNLNYISKNSQTVVGRIIATGSKEGDFSCSIQMEYTHSQINFKYDMLIPIKGCAFFGNLNFSDKDLNLLSNTTKTFSMVNNFNVPIVIYGVKSASSHFSVGHFEPFLLQPNQMSRDISVMFNNYSNAEANCDTRLTIVTNITSFHIKAHGLTGKITVTYVNSKSSILPNHRRSILQEDLGKRYTNSIENFTFIIKNPNLAEFNVYQIKSSEGIEIDCPTEFTVGPESEYQLNILALFKPVNDSKRTDQITFFGRGKSLLVIFTWIPVRGSIIVSKLKKGVLYGYNYRRRINITSTYNNTLKVYSAFSDTPSKLAKVDLINKSIELKPNVETHIGNLTFLIERDFIRGSSYEQILEEEKNVKTIIENWSKGPYESTIYFMLQISDTQFLRAELKFPIYFTKITDIELNIGKVLIGSTKNTTIAIPNQYHSPVHFTIFDNENVKFEDTEFTLESDSVAIIDFFFSGKVLGNSSVDVPILTNVSSPFIAKITATTVDIKMNVLPKELHFMPSTIFQRTLRKNITIFNKGDMEIVLDNFSTKPVSSRMTKIPYNFKTNCTTTLYANKSCFVTVVASVWDLSNASFDFVVQSHMTRKSVRLRSTVSFSIFWKICFIKKTAWNLLLLIALFYPVYAVSRFCFLSSKRNKLLEDLQRELPAEIEKLSAPKSYRFSEATQTSGPFATTGGVWSKDLIERECEVSISADIIDAMGTALENID